MVVCLVAEAGSGFGSEEPRSTTSGDNVLASGAVNS